MKPTLNKYLVIFLLIMVGLCSFKVAKYFGDKKLEKQAIELKKLKIKNDELKKVGDGHYQKLVADTLTKKQLQKEIESLKLKVKDGVIVEKIVLVPTEVEKPIDSISISQDSITIEDYYPDRDGWFAKYSAILKFADSTSVGKFTFTELPISLVISQGEDGIFKADLKAPEFITVGSLDVQALPMTPPKIDNFGWLAGGMINKNFDNNTMDYEVLGGFRYKKINILGSVNTAKQVGIGTVIEF